MNDTTLAQQMVAAAPVATRSINLRLNTDSKWMAVAKAGDATLH